MILLPSVFTLMPFNSSTFKKFDNGRLLETLPVYPSAGTSSSKSWAIVFSWKAIVLLLWVACMVVLRFVLGIPLRRHRLVQKHFKVIA